MDIGKFIYTGATILSCYVFINSFIELLIAIWEESKYGTHSQEAIMKVCFFLLFTTVFLLLTATLYFARDHFQWLMF